MQTKNYYRPQNFKVCQLGELEALQSPARWDKLKLKLSFLQEGLKFTLIDNKTVRNKSL